MAAHTSSDTIAAQATPPGRGGIAVVRVSGPLVLGMMQSLLGKELLPRQATHLDFLAEDGDTLDSGIAIFFPNPHSFTGEDVLELQGHGGPVVVDMLLQRLLALGARIARPGEFSERAYLNGKLDLTQAEAIADLIDASSTQAARLAVRSLQGVFSDKIHQLSDQIIQLRIYIEAAIDFTDEEIDFLSADHVLQAMHNMIDMVRLIQSEAKQSSFLREGITAVIAGEPNVGKSSLLNRLSGQDIAIVTNIPGTTRDVLRHHILIDGMPVHILDTAGLRESGDLVEQEGIKRAYHEIEKADVILYMVTDESSSISLASSSQPLIKIRNKIDLLGEEPSLQQLDSGILISLSAKTGAGVELLTQHIKQVVGFNQQLEGTFLARRRHLDALARALHYLELSLEQLQTTKAGELAAEDLRLAHQCLCEITGEFTADDLLGKIFSSFCIGK